MAVENAISVGMFLGLECKLAGKELKDVRVRRGVDKVIVLGNDGYG